MLAFLKRGAAALPVGIAFTDLVASVTRVDGPSMQPTLNPAGQQACDWVLVEKISSKLFHKYYRGDIVVLWAPDSPHELMIKRVMAIEGDVINKGPAFNGKIPQGRCWIEGDNPLQSADSRNAYGPVHLGLIEGRVLSVIWPPSRFQLL